MLPGMSIPFSANVLFFFGKLIPFVTFDFLPPEYSTMLILMFDENGIAYNDSLGEIGYETPNFVLNCGSLFIFAALLIL